MKITKEISLSDFDAWCGAIETLNILREHDACDTLECVIEDCYPYGVDETTINDLLWFEPEWCFEVCGIENPYGEDDEEDEEDKE